ncbi:MAG: patatin-like phospholipase family protein [Kiritimatiellae bacterium]|nr:patatin-like phospholipase family protein [Kiritimatiellia bacterium]
MNNGGEAVDPHTHLPVRFIPTDDPEQEPEAGMALCLSGGGYRAMLFHAGALWRLNELGYLPKLARISSVSGGSITSAMLALRWEALAFDEDGVGQAFEAQVVAPIRGLARRTLDVRSVVGGALGPGSINEWVVAAYRTHLYGDATLQDMPDTPRFVFNATNVQSGALWRFMKPYMRDYRVGEVRTPRVALAAAVAASSAFPPFLSPAVLNLDPSAFTPGSGTDLQIEPFTTEVVLTDGGVLDNFGLETAWKRYETVLVSDGGGHMKPEGAPKHDWARHTFRVLSMSNSEIQILRKRQLLQSYRLREVAGAAPDEPLLRLATRQGAYWGVRSDIANYGLADALDAPFDKTLPLAEIATRLKCIHEPTQERLVNWGYAICDAAMRKHVDAALHAPHGFPYAGGVG